MILLDEKKLDISECENSLIKLANLLASKKEFSETELHTFFNDNSDLLLLMGNCFNCQSAQYYRSEFSIFNEFRADFVIANRKKSKFLFVEFEDAKKNSIFKPKSINTSQISYEWASRFEHGFSQIVDWYYRMDDYARTNKFEEHFGNKKIEYNGILIIGRSQFLKTTGTEKRFMWRKENTIINNKLLLCITFDQLLEELQEVFDTLKL